MAKTYKAQIEDIHRGMMDVWNLPEEERLAEYDRLLNKMTEYEAGTSKFQKEREDVLYLRRALV